MDGCDTGGGSRRRDAMRRWARRDPAWFYRNEAEGPDLHANIYAGQNTTQEKNCALHGKHAPFNSKWKNLSRLCKPDAQHSRLVRFQLTQFLRVPKDAE